MERSDSNYAECLPICDSIPECTGFTYDKINNKCQFKNISYDPNFSNYDNNYDYYEKTYERIEEPASDTNIYKKYDYTNNDPLLQYPVSNMGLEKAKDNDPNTCKIACDIYPECRGYTYNKNTEECRFTTKPYADKLYEINNNYDYYEKQINSDMVQFSNNKELTGGFN